MNAFYHAGSQCVKPQLPRTGSGLATIGAVGKKAWNLWLDAAHKKQMGQRISAAIRQAKTTNAKLANTIGCTRQNIHYARKNGSVSLELAAELARLTNSSLDWLVFGRHPKADPEFMDLLSKLQAAAAKPPH